MFTNLKTMNHLKVRLLIVLLLPLLMNDIKAQIANNKDSIITQVCIFDGKSYYGAYGQKIYKINTYCIWAKDISKPKFSMILGKEIKVTGKFMRVQGKTIITTTSNGESKSNPSQDYYYFIEKPEIKLLDK